jgi:hypothetical protein
MPCRPQRDADRAGRTEASRRRKPTGEQPISTEQVIDLGLRAP